MNFDELALEGEFYAKDFYFSYSSLNKLLYSPSAFYKHYILNEREDKVESYLITGKVIHSLLLDKGRFDDFFVVVPTNLPGDSIRRIVDYIFKEHFLKQEEFEKNLEDYDKEILAYMQEINLYQSLVDDKKDVHLTGDKKRLEKIITDQSKQYFSYLKSSLGKDLIDEETLRICEEAVVAVKQNKRACELLNTEAQFELQEVYNEMFISRDYRPVYPFGLKGIIDNITIDHSKKVITICDLKTSGKTLSEFPTTIEFYNYWLQAALYVRMVHHELVLSKPDANMWKINFHFVVVDKFNMCYVFDVTDETMNVWQERLTDVLNKASYHYSNRSFNLPYEFLVGNVKL